MFAHRHVVLQVLFMDAAKRAQKIAESRPATFAGIGMHFTDAITIVIARPFVLTVADRRVRTRQASVTAPLVSVTGGLWPGGGCYVLLQRRPVGAFDHSQA